jgi:hypothetical protein
MNWEQANYLCKKLKLDNYGDWRLPSVKELKGLYKKKGKLTNVKVAGYWTSSTDIRYENTYFFIYFGNGKSGWNGKRNENYTRCVRKEN